MFPVQGLIIHVLPGRVVILYGLQYRRKGREDAPKYTPDIEKPAPGIFGRMAGSGRPSIRQAHATHEIRCSCLEVHRHLWHRNGKRPAVSQQQRSGLSQSRRASGCVPAGPCAEARHVGQRPSPSVRDAAKDGFHFPDVLRRLQVEVRPVQLSREGNS
jgi:hypothetical protein